MLTVLIEYIVWLKTHYNGLFNLLKFGIAIATAYGTIIAFKGQRARQLGSVLVGIQSELADLETKGAIYRQITRRNQRLQARLDSINTTLANRTAHAVLERATKDRTEGNYEASAHLLATWFDAERGNIAKATGYLANWNERRAEAGSGNADAAQEAARLKRVAALVAPAESSANGSVTVTAR